MEKIVCVVGPTASGKTKMGVRLAQHFRGEVVSVDSMQIYQGMTVGTAAPTTEEMEGIPHHMIAVADPKENWSVARFREEADKCIQDILSRGKLPILVGGTGLYLDAIIQGNSFAPGDKTGEIRQELLQRTEEEGLLSLYEELQLIDPDSAERLHVNDEKRIIRALEVYYETGHTMTEHNEETQKTEMRYQPIFVGLNFEDRQNLRDRIDVRVDQMVKEGLLQEVKALLGSGLPKDATALQAIGYKQFLSVADGLTTEEEAIEEVKLRSRQYAKRQLTWLRRNNDIHWITWGKEPNFDRGVKDAITYVEGKL